MLTPFRNYGSLPVNCLWPWFVRFASTIALAASYSASGATQVILAPEKPVVAAESAPVRALLKFVKTDSANKDEPVAKLQPASCKSCKPMNDPNFDRDNTRETLIGVWVPRRRTLELRFTTAPNSIKRVVLQTGDLPFRVEGDQLVVSVPPLWHDAVTAAELSTHLVEPGVVLRLEHADPSRRAGKYKEGEFPIRQRQAADNLQFALREFIRSSGLGRYVADQRLGAIMLMGFDTNLPFGHVDFPPHFHMHLRWPTSAGTQIAHFYIDESALLRDNTVGFRDIGAKQRVFGRGETFTTFDLHGRPVYSHTLTMKGGLQVSRHGQLACEINPLTNGFDSGAVLECPGQDAIAVKVSAQLSSGLVQVQTGNIEETFRIDPDTGWLLSASKPPPQPPSAYTPPDY